MVLGLRRAVGVIHVYNTDDDYDGESPGISTCFLIHPDVLHDVVTVTIQIFEKP